MTNIILTDNEKTVLRAVADDAMENACHSNYADLRHDNPGAATVKEVADTTGFSVSTVRAVMGSLVKKGLVVAGERNAQRGNAIEQYASEAGINVLVELFDNGDQEDPNEVSAADNGEEQTTEVQPRTDLTDDLVIRVLVEKNPKRKGTAAYKRFNVYKDGMTVGEFLDAAHKLEKKAKPRYRYLTDLHWDKDREFIKVVSADEAAEEAADKSNEEKSGA